MPFRVLPGRRQLTVLYCGLIEEPALVRLDPEDFHTVVQAFYTACEAVIQRFNAQPATVVLSADTYHLVHGYFTCQALDETLSTGGGEQVILYRVFGESGRHTRFEVAAMHGLTPFVGREAELTLLRQRWAQVKALLEELGTQSYLPIGPAVARRVPVVPHSVPRV